MLQDSTRLRHHNIYMYYKTAQSINVDGFPQHCKNYNGLDILYSLPEHLSDDMSRSRPAVLVDACLESKMSAIAFRRPVLPEVINSSKLFGTSTSAIVSVKVVFFIENATNFAVSKICKND